MPAGLLCMAWPTVEERTGRTVWKYGQRAIGNIAGDRDALRHQRAARDRSHSLAQAHSPRARSRVSASGNRLDGSLARQRRTTCSRSSGMPAWSCDGGITGSRACAIMASRPSVSSNGAAIAALGKKQLVLSIERAAAWSSGSGPPEGRRSSRGGQLPVRSGDPPADSGGVRNPSPSARLSWVRRRLTSARRSSSSPQARRSQASRWAGSNRTAARQGGVLRWPRAERGRGPADCRYLAHSGRGRDRSVTEADGRCGNSCSGHSWWGSRHWLRAWDRSSSLVLEPGCGTDIRGPSRRSDEGDLSALKPRPVIELGVDSCQTAGDADTSSRVSREPVSFSHPARGDKILEDGRGPAADMERGLSCPIRNPLRWA